jgi:hypothetical protein
MPNPQSLTPDKDLVRAALSLVDCPNNRREEERRPLTLPSYFTSVDKDDKPRGKTISAVTTDISRGGLSLLCTQAIEPPACIRKYS